ncbi:MAG: thiosulfohydrolase SoxB [Proteobacteria bacterium]|nr:thiosulfohydrolase SoxB [Pseudomonadota bacterium]
MKNSGMNRREFLEILAAGTAAGLATGCTIRNKTKTDQDFYQLGQFGQVRLMHFTDCHAQLKPIYFREPSVNIGIGDAKGRPPHLVGDAMLGYFSIPSASRLAHAFSYLDFNKAASKYGKVGGFAYLASLIKQLRAQYGTENTLLLDGGDTWQGSGTSLWTRGMDMVRACNLLGVDVMTGHWEFTYKDEEVLANIEKFNGEFLANNILVSEEALFDDAPAYDEDTGHAFKPYTIKHINGKTLAIIGQAFPYTSIANPSRFMPDWSFGIRDSVMQDTINQARATGADAVILLSHNGMDVDIKMASKVTGIDVILGGHTHDGIPKPIEVSNSSGKTWVTNAGSNGKFLAVLDLDIGKGRLNGIAYKLLPIFSNLLKADTEMAELIEKERAPYQDILSEKLAVCDQLLYRRGNFNGTFDQLICDAQRAVGDAQIALSPGFRWGTTILPGQDITMEHLLDQTAITYPETYLREMTGENIKLILEDVCDNLFNKDPYYQQGGDMVRVGGLDYHCDVNANIGNRISNMTLDNGTAIEAGKSYKVAGWSQVGSKAEGPPIWEVVREYLRSNQQLTIKKLNTPKLI